MKDNSSEKQYINQLRSALQVHGIKDIDEITEDYEEYFAHSTAKGYSIAESIRRLPSPDELAKSYVSDVVVDRGTRTPATSSKQLSHSGRWSLFAATILSELMILPFAAVAGLFLACIGVTGLLLFVAGILMAMPESVLGGITIPHPPSPQLIPAMALFMAGGVVITGITLIITERSYSAVRASIVLKRWILTGKHDNHLKLIPSVSKPTRQILYKTVLFSALIAVAAIILLTVVASISTDSASFLSSWNI